MIQLHCPWLEVSILLPLFGALVVACISNPQRARIACTVIAGLTLCTSIGAWIDLSLVHASEAVDRWDLATLLLGRRLFSVDELSAPLLPAVALLYFLTMIATPGTKLQRFSFGWSLVFEAVRLATFSCSEPWPLIVLLAIGTWPPYRELLARNRPTRVYVLHMGLFITLLVLGQILADQAQGREDLWLPAGCLLLTAVLIRSGMFPFHCWMTELFEQASFGTALLFVAPLTGAYAAIRLLLPVAPDLLLRVIGSISLFTAIYAAGMSLIQNDARRLYCYLFLSHSALVLVGLEMATPIGFTGGLCVWLSVIVALSGLGLTLRAVEARFGRSNLSRPLGYYHHTPVIATCFLITGLASVGFPGTVGFVGMELLIDGAVEFYPLVGAAVAIAGTLNGIAIIRAYFLLFGGPRHESSIALGITRWELFAVLVLLSLTIGGGLLPGPGISSRHHAAEELLTTRRSGDRHSASPLQVSSSAHSTGGRDSGLESTGEAVAPGVSVPVASGGTVRAGSWKPVVSR